MNTKKFKVEMELELESPENIDVDSIVVKDQIDRAMKSASTKDSELICSGELNYVEEIE